MVTSYSINKKKILAGRAILTPHFLISPHDRILFFSIDRAFSWGCQMKRIVATVFSAVGNEPDGD
jgi:hypothetical protein